MQALVPIIVPTLVGAIIMLAGVSYGAKIGRR